MFALATPGGEGRQEKRPFFMFKVCPWTLFQKCPNSRLRCCGSEFQLRDKAGRCFILPPVLIYSFKAPKSLLNIPQINSSGAFLHPQLSLTSFRKILRSTPATLAVTFSVTPRPKLDHGEDSTPARAWAFSGKLKRDWHAHAKPR